MRLRIFLLSAACVAASAFLASCAGGSGVIPPGLSAAEIFQRAQDASDRGDYAAGIRYYSQIETTYPDDINHRTWAAYEIAVCYHKMGKNDMARSLVDDLLARYEKDAAALPPAPRVLSLKLKTRLEETSPPKTP